MNRAWQAIAGSVPALAAALLICSALAAATFPIPQQKSQEQLASLRDEKLAHEVFKKADWTFDYDAALEKAKKSDKLIFAYFTRSYSP